MTAALRLALTLVASLLLWLPTVPSALANHESPEAVGLRYLLSLVVARIGVGLLFRVVRAYATPVLEEIDSQPHDDPAEPEDDSPAATYGRRRDDDTAAEVEDLRAEERDNVEDTATLAS